jgi:hypothetical protein
VTTAARTKAERCFALARSTTFPAEREAAIARGIAIAEKAGLNLDRFDIPGRTRRPAREASSFDAAAFSMQDFVEECYQALRATRRFNDAQRQANMARRRAQLHAADAALHSLQAGQLANALFSRGIPVYDLGEDAPDGRRWLVPSCSATPLTLAELRDLAWTSEWEARK